MKTLVENKKGHGAIYHPVVRSLTKLLRRKRSKLAMATAPYDWSTPFDIRTTIGQIAIKDQGTSFSCSGQAASYFLEIQRRRKLINEGAISAKSIYAPIAFPGGGTTVSELEAQIASHGANLELTVPSYDAYGAPLSELMITDMSWETSALKTDALIRSGYTPFDLTIDIDIIAENIKTWGACILEVRGQNGHTPTWLSSTPSAPVPDNGNEIWHHFLVAIGSTMLGGKKAIIVLNSWGTTVGENGEQYVTEDFFTGKGVVDAFTFIPNTEISPAPTNMSLWAMILRWWRALRGLPAVVQ